MPILDFEFSFLVGIILALLAFQRRHLYLYFEESA